MCSRYCMGMDAIPEDYDKGMNNGYPKEKVQEGSSNSRNDKLQ